MMSTAHPLPTLEPVVTPANAGEARWWFDGLAVIKATAAQTGGLLTVIEITEPPGAVAGRHVHHHDDEVFLIIDGNATFTIGELTVAAGPGDFFFGPRNVPHGYTVGDTGCRMIFILTPGGFEDLLMATSEPAAQRTLPPPAKSEPDWERVATFARAHGCEMLD